MYSIKRKKIHANAALDSLDQSVIPEEPELNNGTEDGFLSVPKSPRKFRDILAKDGISPRSSNSPSPSAGTERPAASAKFTFKDPLANLQTNIADIVHKMKCTGDHLWANERLLTELDCKIAMLSQTLDIFRERVTQLEKGIRGVIKTTNFSRDAVLADLQKVLDETEFKCEIQEVSRLSDYRAESRLAFPEVHEFKLLPKSANLPKSETNLSHHLQPRIIGASKGNSRGSVALDKQLLDDATPPLQRKRIQSSSISQVSPPLMANTQLVQAIPTQTLQTAGGNDDYPALSPIFVASRQTEQMRFNFLESIHDKLPLLESLDGVMSPVMPIRKLDEGLKPPLHESDPKNKSRPPYTHNHVSNPSGRNSQNSIASQQAHTNIEIHEPEPERVVNHQNEADSQTNSRGSRRKTLIRVLGLKQDYALGESSAPRQQVYSGVVTSQQSSHTLELKGVVESKHKDGLLLINLKNPATSGKLSSRRMSEANNKQADKLEGFMKIQAEKSPDMSRNPQELGLVSREKGGFSDYLLPRPLIRISHVSDARQRNPDLQDSTTDRQRELWDMPSSSRQTLQPSDTAPKSSRSGLQSLLATMKRPSQPPTKPPKRPTVTTPQPHLLTPAATPSSMIATQNKQQGSDSKVSHHQTSHARTPSVLPGTFANPARFRGFREAPDI